MRHKTLWSSLCVLGVVAACALLFHRQTPEARLQSTIRRQTTDLPAIDRIEILALGEPQKAPGMSDFKIAPAVSYAGYAPILQTTTVSGSAAIDLGALWRGRQFGGNSALCHEPPYALRFFRGQQLVFETSLCWKCSNCFVSDGDGGHCWLGFDDPDQKLLECLNRFLPLPADASREF